MGKSNSDDSKVSVGMNFEKILAEMYEQMGYEVEITKGSGDQGADLILVKDGKKTVVQAKHSKSKVSSDAVREAIAAKRFYNADYGVVITNSSFQPNAMELAETDQIEMIDNEKLTRMMSNNPQEEPLKPVSKMTFDDIRPKHHNRKKIMQDILQFVLKQQERPRDNAPRGNDMINTILTKLRSELLTKDEADDMLEAILNVLKNEFELDLHEQEKEIQIFNNLAGRSNLHALAQKMGDPYDKHNYQCVAKLVDSIRALEFKSKDDPTKTPVPEKWMLDYNESWNLFPEKEFRGILALAISEAAIYESKPGHYNTV